MKKNRIEIRFLDKNSWFSIHFCCDKNTQTHVINNKIATVVPPFAMTYLIDIQIVLFLLKSDSGFKIIMKGKPVAKTVL